MVISDFVKAVFDAMHEGIVIIDTESRIVFANAAYKNFLFSEDGTDPEEVIGKKIRQLRPGAQLPEILLTGKAEMQAERKESADIYFVNMYPIYENGRVTAAISVVTFLQDANNFKQKLEDLDRRNRQILRRVNEATQLNVSFDDIVSRSPESLKCKEFAKKIACSSAPVLLSSESGTGKDLYARAIHNESPRRKAVFAVLNCATFDNKSLESELFGYAEGAFAGAKEGGKIGLLEAASGGTVFLDEISELNMDTQGKLLRTIQENTVRPLGAVKEIAVDVRIIAASNLDLKDCIASGKFRADLFYALNTFTINIPPLRERMQDLPVLARQIAGQISTRIKKKVVLTDDALDRLMLHEWPGNIRELRSVLEFSAYVSPDGRITSVNLPENIGKSAARNSMPLFNRVRDFEKTEILKALEFYGNDLPGKKAAAAELGISLATLYSKIK